MTRVRLTHDVHHIPPDERLSPGEPDLVNTFFDKEPGQSQDLLCGQQVSLGGQGDALLRHAVLAWPKGGLERDEEAGDAHSRQGGLEFP